MTPGITVRSAEFEDVPGVQSVAESAWHAAHDDIVGEAAVEEFLDRHYHADGLRESVGDDETAFLVAADDDVVGFVNAGPVSEADRWRIYRIYVRPERWGEGIGSRLLARVEDAARDRNAQRLDLVVMAGNEVGVRFYESSGFERVGDHWDENLGVLGYVYEKTL